MNPGEFVDFASMLADSAGSGPAGYRSAVSRAYYSAFLIARGLIEVDLSIRCKSGTLSAHEVVQRFLTNCKVPEAQPLGQLLANLHEHRKSSDYDMDDLTFESQVDAKDC